MAAVVEQWVASVLNFSSQYNDEGSSAQSVIGCPQVYPHYGDYSGSWAPKYITSAEFLEVQYAEAVYVQRVDICETYHAGAVVSLEVREAGGSTWQVGWRSEDGAQCIKQARVLSLPIQTAYKVDALRLTIDCTVARDWVEIDAIKLVGSKTAPPPTDYQLSQDIGRLLNMEQFADVHFHVEGATRYAHWAIICSRCAYFKQIYKQINNLSPRKPHVVNLPEMRLKTFNKVLEYIYMDTYSVADLSPVDMVDVIRAASIYGIEALRLVTIALLEKLVNGDNVASVEREAKARQPYLDDVLSICDRVTAGTR